MIRITFACLLCLLSVVLNAQLPVDNKGKIHFVEIVKDSTNSDSLSAWIKSWVEERYSKNPVTIDSTQKSFATTGRFTVYVKEGVFQQIHGTIRYSLRIEIRENRYRYQFTDFVFEYYRQERSDLKYHPTGKEKPLEDKDFKGSQKLWEKHKVTTDKHVKQMIASLKGYLAQKKAGPKLPDPKTVPTGNDW